MQLAERHRLAPASASEALSLVQTASNFLGRSLSNHGDSRTALLLVLAGCERLRDAALDEVTRYLLGLSEIAATRLLLGLDAPDHLPGELSDADASEIVLLKGLWELEAQLQRRPRRQ